MAPLFVSLRELLPPVDKCCEILRTNRQTWEDMVEAKFKIASRTNSLDDKMNEEWQRWKRRAVSFNEILMVNNSGNVNVDKLYTYARRKSSVIHKPESPDMTPSNSSPATPAPEDKTVFEIVNRKNSLCALENFCKANSKPPISPPLQSHQRTTTGMTNSSNGPTVRFMSMDSQSETFSIKSRGINSSP